MPTLETLCGVEDLDEDALGLGGMLNALVCRLPVPCS